MSDVILVTGSSVGLGRSIVKAALANGHYVVATARNPAALADLIPGDPRRLLVLGLDVTDAESARSAVAEAVSWFGRLDVLINNAGFSGIGSVEEMPIDLVEAQFATNFMGAVNLTRAVLPVMRAQGRGRIVLISSIGARIATAGAAFYYASKAAVSSLAESLALEVAPLGIAVTAIEPGGMRTRFAEAGSLHVSAFDAAYEATVGATAAMMRSSDYTAAMGSPDAVASMILAVAALREAPTRILAGIDSFEMGTRASRAQHVSDLRWAELSRSASIK